MNLIITGSPTRYDKRILHYLETHYPLNDRTVTINFLTEPSVRRDISCSKNFKKTVSKEVVGLFCGAHTRPNFTITIGSNLRTWEKAKGLFHEYGHAVQCHTQNSAYTSKDIPTLEKDADEFALRLRKEATAAGVKYISYKDRMKGWTY
jgi:hypothetical protein